MAQIVLDQLNARFTGGEILESGTMHGDEWARVRRDAWIAVATFLRDDPASKMQMFIDLTCVDRLGIRGGKPDAPRFDVVVSYDLGNSIRVEKGGEIFTGWPAVQAVAAAVISWPVPPWPRRSVGP